MWTMVRMSAVLLVLFSGNSQVTAATPVPTHDYHPTREYDYDVTTTPITDTTHPEVTTPTINGRNGWSKDGKATVHDDFYYNLNYYDDDYNNTTNPTLDEEANTTTPQTPDEVHPPAPQLLCGQSQIQIGLLLTGLQSSGLNGSSGHLADPRCSSFTERDGTVWYQVERQADTCGNTLTTNNTHAIYSNHLVVYPANDVSLPVTVPFSCVYPLDTETSLDVAIGPNNQLEAVVGVGSPSSASMSLFQNSNYTEPYPAGPAVTLPLGSALYVGVSVGEIDPRFVVVLDDCYATPSSSPDDRMRHFIVQNMCPTNRRQVTVVESGSSLQARFSALLFLFHGDYRDIYLHCSLHLCDQRASSCSPVCSRRRRRSVSTSVPFKPVTIGPITWDKLLE